MQTTESTQQAPPHPLQADFSNQTIDFYWIATTTMSLLPTAILPASTTYTICLFCYLIISVQLINYHVLILLFFFFKFYLYCVRLNSSVVDHVSYLI